MLITRLLTIAAIAALGLFSEAHAARYERYVMVDGMERHYIAQVPWMVKKKKDPISVVFAFHPGMSSAAMFEATNLLHLAPGAYEFITVYPDGYEGTWNSGDCCGPALWENIDDMAFVEAILADLEKIAPISPDRNFAVGFSNGGSMSHQLGCFMSNRFAAIAGSGGTRDMLGGCPLERPVAVFNMHGLEDPFSPYEGGLGVNVLEGERPSVQSMIDSWVASEGAVFTGTVTKLDDLVTCDRYVGSAEIINCPIPDLGHWWPGADGSWFNTQIFGPWRAELPAREEVIQFFLNH